MHRTPNTKEHEMLCMRGTVYMHGDVHDNLT